MTVVAVALSTGCFSGSSTAPANKSTAPGGKRHTVLRPVSDPEPGTAEGPQHPDAAANQPGDPTADPAPWAAVSPEAPPSAQAQAHFARGSALLAAAKYEPAIEAFSAAIAIDDRYHFAFYNRGLAYLELAQYDRARADRRATVALQPAWDHWLIGTVLIYEPFAGPSESAGLLQWDELLEVVDRRVNVGSAPQAQIRAKDGRLHVRVFGHERETLERIEAALSMRGTLEFMRLASRKRHPALIAAASFSEAAEVLDSDGELVGRWVPRASTSSTGDLRLAEDPDVVMRRTAEGRSEVLVVVDPHSIHERHLVRAEARHGSAGSTLYLRFNDEGAAQLSQLTGSHLPKTAAETPQRLGMIVDGYLLMAHPLVNRFDRELLVQGNLTAQEVDVLASVYGAGPLVIPLRQVGRIDLD